MDLSAIIEVAIGLIFVWITISLATIQIQEWIGQIGNKRAKDLEVTIHTMLANERLKDLFYEHPIIRGLIAKKGTLPSYIPSQQFALALFDIAMTAGTESSLIQQGLESLRNDLEKAKEEDRNKAAIEELNLLADLAKRAATTDAGTAFTDASFNLLKSKIDDFSAKHADLKPSIDDLLKAAAQQKNDIEDFLKNQKVTQSPDLGMVQLRRGVAALGAISPQLHKTLSALLLNVEDYTGKGESQLGLARKNVEKWFDDSMDRLNGVFKRYAQFWAFVIGLYLAVALNIDSINLAIYLWRDPTIRQVLVANASKLQLPEASLATDPEQAMQDIRQQFVGLNLPIGWVINKGNGDKYESYLDSECQLFPNVNQAFGIPIVVNIRDFKKICIAPPQSNNQTNIALKFFGLLFTAVAAAQGAPFWFDLLKKLINLRGTGANPVEKEASK
jgi:hypothetical protein